MSAEVIMRAAVLAALRDDAALMAQVNALFDGELAALLEGLSGLPLLGLVGSGACASRLSRALLWLTSRA